jgi:amino acid adenylation domain-containing protein
MKLASINQLTINERERLLKMAEARSLRKTIQFAAIPVSEHREEMPLSFAQQRLWFLAQMQGGSRASHMPLRLRIRGQLEKAMLRRALDRIMERHEALRTSFVMVKGEPRQRIAGVDESRFHLLEHDLRESGDVEAELKQLEREEAGAEFNLETGPLVRGRLVRVGEAEHWLLITMHHIVSDGWSLGIFFKELSELYRAYMRGEDDGLPELEIQYVDYAVWQRKWMEKEGQLQQAEYWRKNLAGVPELLELPGDRIRPARQDYTGALVKVELAETITAGLKELSQRHGATLYMTLLAAWAVLLRRLSGQLDVVIGTPVANRGRVETENLIGFFVNMLAVRVDLSGRPAMSEVVERVKRQAIAAQHHQEVPFEQVVEMVQPVRSLAHTPLFQVTFTWLDPPQDRPELPGVEARLSQGSWHATSKFDLQLLLQEKEGRIEGGVEYATALFDEETIKRYVGYYGRLVGEMVKDAGQVADSVPLLEEEERRRIVYEWNETAGEIPGRCVHELFEEEVERRPDAAAVIRGKETVSYGELNRRANRLARRLKGWGVGRETRVGVCLERSVEMIVAMLGISKAGGAYVPLDAGYPGERLSQMMEDGEIGVVVTEKRLRDELPVEATGYVPMMCMDEEREGEEEEREENLGEEMGSGQLLYVMHTSGSTGRAKGVMVTHENVVRLVRNTNYVRLGEEVVLGHASNVMFDASTFEIWGALLNGGRLVVIRKEEVMSPERLGSELREKGVTTLFLTTAMYQECVRSGRGVFQGVKTVLFGGEQCDGECVGRSVEEAGAEEVVHVYGPTETTTYATYGVVRGVGKGKGVPIGGPIGNTEIYIVDEEMEAVGIGVVGEICVGGKGVTRGYGKNAEMTAEKYVPNGVREGGGERLYRTGDLGRWRKDGQIEFVGRRDHQVKIRGYRIELGEVETVLRAQPGVKDAVIVVRGDRHEELRMVAYYTVNSSEQHEGVRGELSPGAEELYSYLLATLPDYMAPDAYVRLEQMPRKVNGEVDRGALPSSEEETSSARRYEAPKGEIEAAVAKIWADVLQMEQVGRNDNFFTLGGRSLLAVQVMARLQQTLELELGINDLFARPVLSDFVQGIEGARKSRVPAITPVDRGRPLPLSFAQERLWFLAQFEGGSEAYHMPFSMRLRGKLDIAALKRALDGIVARHEMLRTIFVVVAGEPSQQIEPSEKSSFHLLECDLRQHPDRPGELERLTALEAKTEFDLQAGPLIRGRLVRLAAEEYALLITMHHIISDEWSMRTMARELRALYAAFVNGDEDPLPALALQYGDYSVWQRQWIQGGVLQEQTEYWRGNMAGVPDVLEVPADYARPAVQQYEGRLEKLTLKTTLTAGLKELSKRCSTTLYMTLLAGWAALLSRLSGQRDVVIGMAVANRARIEVEDLIGYFVSPLALRIDLSGSPTVAEGLKRVKKQVLAAQQHQDIPFEQVLEIVQPARSMAHSPLFQVMFAWQSAPVDRLDLPGLEITPMEDATSLGVPFDLTLSLRESGDVITGGAAYATSLYELPTVQRYLGYLERLLDGMSGNEAAILDCLPMMSEQERTQVVVGWNATEAAFGPDLLAHEIFEQQAEKTPDSIAVASERSFLSYRELNLQVNQLAHYLIHQGVKPEAAVGVCLERGLELIVAFLAVLKAGGIYVALDPKYPADRLTYMAEDAKACFIITTMEHKQWAQGVSEKQLILDDEECKAEIRRQPGENLRGAISGENLAYLMYTSGSTGQPKGAMIHHHGMLNHLLAKIHSLKLSEKDNVAQNAPSSFDISIWQMLASLLAGGRIQIVPDGTALDASGLLESMEKNHISVLETVPTMLAMMVENSPGSERAKPGLRGLRWLISNAEALTAGLCRQWFEAWPEIALVNTYGATECSDDISHHEQYSAPQLSSGLISLGKPLMNLRAYLLDEYGAAVPAGVRGEIYIAGQGVGRGYWNRPDITAERFVPDSFAEGKGERMYRTGDLGRWSKDGTLEFDGRIDHQVKVRGFRIELGEIEECLAEHAGVKEAVVLVRDDAAGEKRLVAYYTCLSSGEVGEERKKIAAEELRRHTEAKLPEYMVPSAYVCMERLPLTPNGKVDRRGLPTPQGDAYVVREYQRPEGEVETLLAEIWAELLKTEHVGRRDNFFELGGHSLLATRLITRIEHAAGVHISIRTVFKFPQLSELASQIRQAQFAEFDAKELAHMMRDF